ncbi:hypothetical protein RHMOL_Rhmol01G0315000 [Rhododendron molle]|uniref:Uncharacterized protein n=1 Tax=Rhododendron molle TaxID=49168 RepID=A0ACC0QB24_RHOML|nr:hypothetical protein RHMOL_Rhmol01G0315000 [Rhododendron molle]
MAEDENQFVYNGFDGANLHLDGAKIHSNGLLQLTNTSKQQIGRAFYQLPIRFDTSSSRLGQDLSFSTHFVFAIVPEITNLSCCGMAFAISPSTDFTKALGNQYFGLLNTSSNGLSSNHLLAIELDTLTNPEFNDTNDNHVGIDINSLVSNVSAPVMYYSNRERINRSLLLVSGSPMQVWIEYDGSENVLNVTIAPITSPKPDVSLLSTHINLSSILLDSMYVGFSAATGLVTGNHYILGWSFNKSGKAQGLEISKLPSLPRQRKPGQGITVGYLAPELTRTGKATTSTDVFAFGAFVLEVACGRRPIQLLQSPEKVVLVDWVFEKWKEGAILVTSDPRLGGDYLEEEMELVLKLGLLCSKSNAVTRPSMRQVMQYLNGDALLPEIIHDSTSIGTIGLGNEASSEFVMSFPTSTMKSSAANSLSGTESILNSGRGCYVGVAEDGLLNRMFYNLWAAHVHLVICITCSHFMTSAVKLHYGATLWWFLYLWGLISRGVQMLQLVRLNARQPCSSFGAGVQLANNEQNAQLSIM